MRFSENLLFKGINEDEKEEILNNIKCGNDVFNIYLLCKSQSQNLFELFEASELLTSYYSRQNYLVLGIARGKQKGMELAKEIIENYYNKKGSLEGLKTAF
ncbi:MAG: hypothetical protein LIO87_02830 [Eubacterium sp.]|nr:hypothetical protein [Eubacterium sp.]